MKLRRTEIIVSIVIVLVASAMFATVVRFSAVWTTVCAICGAREQQTRWVFGFKSTPVRESSPLAQWLSRQGRAHEHRWEHLDVQGRNVFGRGISAGSSGHPPPICSVQPALIDQFLRTASESEIEEFVRLMLSGSEDEQKQFIRQKIRRPVQDGR